ncbi:hypothetical protein A0H81_13705, partial [Grifola frondosa]
RPDTDNGLSAKDVQYLMFRKAKAKREAEGRSLPKRDLKFELGLLTEFQRTQDLARKLRESKAAQVAPKPPRGAGRRSRKTKAVRVNTGHTKPDSTAAATGDESSAAVKIDRVTGKQTAVAPPRMRFGLLDADTDVDTPTGSESNTVGTMVLAGDSRKELVRDVAREAMAFFVEEFKDVLAMPKAMQAMHEDLSGQLAPLRTIPADLEKVSQGQTVLQDFSQVNKEITDIKLGNLETSTASLAAVTETLRLELHALKLAKTSNTVEDTAGMPQAVVEKPGRVQDLDRRRSRGFLVKWQRTDSPASHTRRGFCLCTIVDVRYIRLSWLMQFASVIGTVSHTATVIMVPLAILLW